MKTITLALSILLLLSCSNDNEENNPQEILNPIDLTDYEDVLPEYKYRDPEELSFDLDTDLNIKIADSKNRNITNMFDGNLFQVFYEENKEFKIASGVTQRDGYLNISVNNLKEDHNILLHRESDQCTLYETKTKLRFPDGTEDIIRSKLVSNGAVWIYKVYYNDVLKWDRNMLLNEDYKFREIIIKK